MTVSAKRLKHCHLSAAMMDPMPRRLTDTELLLWNLEQNPKLSSTMGAVMILDGPPDPDRLRAKVSHALRHVAPLRERVYEASSPVGVPSWGLDTHFDLASHLRFVRLPTPSNRRSLFQLATELINDPFDRTRPLWSWTVVTGLPGGKAAVISKLHHSVADGQGALELAAHLLDFEADAAPPVAIDPDTVLADLDEDATSADSGSGLRSTAERLLAGLTQAAESVQNPAAALAAGQDLAATVRSFTNQDEQITSESSLFSGRSRNRRGGFLSVPVASMASVAKASDRRLNDVFVAATARGVVRYHEAHDESLGTLSVTVVVNTRRPGSNSADTNAFVPVSLNLPGSEATPDELLDAVATQVSTRREQVAKRQGLIGPLTGLAGMLPPQLAVAATLGQTAQVDLSTSNLPGPPMPVWIAGQRVAQLYPLGPVGGTPCNATLLSYDGTAAVGLHTDPAAISDTELFEQCVADGFVDLGVRRPKTR